MDGNKVSSNSFLIALPSVRMGMLNLQPTAWWDDTGELHLYTHRATPMLRLFLASQHQGFWLILHEWLCSGKMCLVHFILPDRGFPEPRKCHWLLPTQQKAISIMHITLSMCPCTNVISVYSRSRNKKRSSTAFLFCQDFGVMWSFGPPVAL